MPFLKNPAPSGGERANDIIKGARRNYDTLNNEMTIRGLCYSTLKSFTEDPCDWTGTITRRRGIIS